MIIMAITGKTPRCDDCGERSSVKIVLRAMELFFCSSCWQALRRLAAGNGGFA